MSRRASIEFDAISVEGGLLPAEWLGRIALLDAPQQSPGDYGVLKGLNLRDELGRYWRVAEAHYREFSAARREGAHPEAATRRWLEVLLGVVLQVPDIEWLDQAIERSERAYPLSARALGGRLPIVIAPHEHALDARLPRFGDAGRQRSAFGLLQDYLNAADEALWGIASNGLVLRLARDNASLTRPALIEVDLERIFAEERFADFSLLWLLLHGSRFGQPGQPLASCALEVWREASREEGTRARDQLRNGVEDALLALGQGFLAHPDNEPLRVALANGALDRMDYFRQLLRLVYRLIFLLTIEERGLLHPPGSAVAAVDVYARGYSLRRLRERARRQRAYDRHHDLWEGLKPVWQGLAAGQPLLALPPLGGLFAAEQCPDLESAGLPNTALLAAVFRLGWMRADGSLVRINWRDMGPEEFGSVYESLLELVPEITSDGRGFRFAGAEQSRGNARKTSGSYYTPDTLVQELLESALEPVIAERLRGAATPSEAESALLSITVCDPACGSGHFLLAAARRIAQHLARLRAGGTPSGDDYRHALRDVISHCIYGVDRNPMALELARTALWLEAMTPDKPLGFLDHHLQCGDALLGVLDPAILARGMPAAAFEALSGDDKAVASALKRRNATDQASFTRALSAGDLFRASAPLAEIQRVEGLAEDDLAAIDAKRRVWMQAASEARDSKPSRLADLFVGAFLLPKRKGDETRVPTSQDLWQLAEDGRVEADKLAAARAACATHRVFHWWLAFPQIAAQGGFTVMLGNPPWERIKLQEEEFFAAHSPLVAQALNKAERARRIEWLSRGALQNTLDGLPDAPPSAHEIRIHESFLEARRAAEAASLYAHDSGRYPLTGVGDVNTYALFAETYLSLKCESGRVGIVIPSGIATDDSTKAFFAKVADGQLVSLFDLRTGPGLFPDIGHQRYKFCLLTLGPAARAEFLFFALRTSEIRDPLRRFQLTAAEFRLINPNTLTCPVFRSQRDAELTKKLYRQAPVLIRDAIERVGNDGKSEVETPEVNPWGIRFSTMFHMSNDSGLFHSEPAALGAPLRLPLYEAKMVHHYDHRWATYVDAPDKPAGIDTEDASDAEKANPAFRVRPRYWVDECEVLARIARLPSRVGQAWLARCKVPMGDYAAQLAADEVLVLAVAGWLAGECFRRRLAGISASDDLRKLAPRLVQPIDDELTRRFPALQRALAQSGLSGARLAAEYAKWARQDSETPLSDDDLAALARVTADTASRDATPLRELLDAWMDQRSPRWLMGWRDICRSTDERTVIASVIARVAVGHTTPLWFSPQPAVLQAALLACMDSLVLDYIARQKVGGTHLTYGFLKQFPVLPPERYTHADLEFIVPRVLELTYTAHDLAPWAADLGYQGPPFAWNPDRRAQLRAELDAYYARLYGLDRDELRYILDPADTMGPDYPSETFRVLKNNEIRQYGEYRTQRLVLAAWDALDR